MKRFSIAIVAVALAAAALAAWSLAAPSSEAGRASAEAATKFPPLPSEVRNRKRWIIGVKCDFPPFGFIDVRGKHGGYDVEVAQRFAELAFGRRNRVSLICVTTPSRIPALQTKRVDIIISTLTWTKARTEVIDFSIPYYGATGRLLVLKTSSVRSMSDLDGKTVVTTRGALYAPWTRLCARGARLLEVDSTTNAVLAVKDGRADTFMFDDAFVLGVATTDKELRLTADKFLAIPWGIGIRKGETGMRNWVNAALRSMQKQDRFWAIMRRNAPKSLVDDFKSQVPRPGRSLRYPEDRDAATDCSVSR